MTSTKNRWETDWALAYIVLGAVAVVVLLAIAAAPVAALLGDSQFAIPSALHGMVALVYVIVATVVAYLAFLLYRGRLEASRDAPAAAGLVGRLDSYRELRLLAALQAGLAAAVVMLGNWIYIYYRAPAGPRAYFLENNPAVHEIFFEFKEFIALFTVPLTLAGAFVLWREGDRLRDHPRLRQAAAVLLMLSWLYLMLAFGLGAAITKLRSV